MRRLSPIPSRHIFYCLFACRLFACRQFPGRLLPRPLGALPLLALPLFALLHAPLSAQAHDLCAASAYTPPAPRAIALADAARREHQAWGGATIDAHGRLTDAGAYEAEDTPRGLFTPPPWQRVLRYWKAVDDGGAPQPSQVRFGALWPADRKLLLQAVELASAARLQGLGAGQDVGLSSSEQRAITAAIDRAAVVDTPWSAVFVSWLAREAGLGAQEFAFSEAHADYAAFAWHATEQEAGSRPTPSALRACDLLRTPPRVGDLVCQARGRAASIDSFEALTAVLAQRHIGAGGSLPMHCDVVVQVDATGFEAIGGNVLQAVTQRRLDFAPGTRLLDASYLPAACAGAGTGTAGGASAGGAADTKQPGPPSACAVDRHMNRQPWSLLLQWR